MPAPVPAIHAAPPRRLTLIACAIMQALTAWPGASLAEERCPPAAPPAPEPATDAPAPADADADSVQFEADGVEAQRDGAMLLKGEVVISQGGRHLKTRDALYDAQTQSFKIDQPVEYSDPDLKVRGATAQVAQQGGATFADAQFELPARGGRGAAARIQARSNGELELDGVRYTTCPLGNEDWVLKASDIDISQRDGIGIGRGVRLDFKGVPILYTPFISFPVSAERKSGFLFPTFGTSSSSGYSLSAPWYWNIAPNYDATLVPTWYSKRGARLDSELRFLHALGRGALDIAYLPHDQEVNTRAPEPGDPTDPMEPQRQATDPERSLLRFRDRSDLGQHLRLDIDAANASDSQWFEDFGLGPEGTSISYLERSAQLTYLSDQWHAVLRAQNFQTIDDLGIAPQDRPHTLLPQLALQAEFPQQPYGVTLGFDLELDSFSHNYDSLVDTGWRVDVIPELRMPLRGAGLYLEPAARWHYTSYRLEDVDAPRDDSPDRSAPVWSVDGGLVLERLWSSPRQTLLHTLEPRFQYLYVPHRKQDQLPVFDATLADLNLVQLFRTNRYTSADRLGDANQLALGLTSRLLEAESGRQLITATIGQAYLFHSPRVRLPEETPDDKQYSDLIAELDLTAFGNWNISMGLQWDPGETRSEKGDVQLQYRPAHDQVANLGYRFRRGSLEQVDGSLAWPVGRDLSAYARLVYSLEDEKSLDQFAGLEYRSCCWRLRLVGRRSVSDRTGDRDTSVLLQLELNGLASVGEGADTFLERSIRGYSPSPAASSSFP